VKAFNETTTWQVQYQYRTDPTWFDCDDVCETEDAGRHYLQWIASHNPGYRYRLMRRTVTNVFVADCHYCNDEDEV
jgi:hypothetical protein